MFQTTLIVKKKKLRIRTSKILINFFRSKETGLELKCTELANMVRARMKQKTKALLKKNKHGDEKTKFFQLQLRVGTRRIKKNYIQCLRTDHYRPSSGLLSKEGKEQELYAHFQCHLGETLSRTVTLNWDALDYQARDISHLEDPFEEDEIKSTIFSMPTDKAPRWDGFTGMLFKQCWEIIKLRHSGCCPTPTRPECSELQVDQLRQYNSHPKENGNTTCGGYKTISLIHGVAKIFSKNLT